jgi:hypothetical protein
MPAATLKALHDRVAAVDGIETAGKATILATRWDVFHKTIDATVALGSFVSGPSIAGKLSGKATSVDIAAAFKTESSGLYIADADARPTQSKLSRAIDIAADDSAERREAFKTAGNAPAVVDYVVWLKLAAGKTLGNGHKVDIAATVTGTGKARKVGKVTRIAPTPTTTTTSTAAAPIADVVPEWGVLSMASDEDLAAVPAVVDLSTIAPDMLPALARQIIAAIVVAERASKVATLAVLPVLS